MPRLTLIQRRSLSRLNRLRALSRVGWRLLPIGLASTIVLIYGIFWAESLVRDLAGLDLVERSRLRTIAGLVCLAFGLSAGFAASAQDRAALAAPFLAVLPWPGHARRDAVLLSLLSRLATSTAIVFLALRLGSDSAGLNHAAFDTGAATSAYAAGFAVGCGLCAIGRHRAEPVLRAPCQARTSGGAWLTRLDHAAPRWAGWWALASRLRCVILLGIGSMSASLSFAEAASRSIHPVMIAPGLAIIGPLIVLITAISCAPLTSPVLRTSPVRYHRAALAMLRLPASLAAAWFAIFAIAALMLDLIRLRALAAVGAIALLLGLGYALAALSVPTSSRLATTLYLTALAFAADQYATLQNLDFAILFCLLIFLVFRARALFHARR